MSAAMAKEARRAMRAKASRMADTADPAKSVDASSWRPPPALNAGRKTGARPIRPRIYKHGGKIQGDRAPHHAGKAPRTPRADGGALTVYDTADANKRQLGSFHDGGYKRGGMPDAKSDMAMIKTAVHKHEKHDHKGEPLTKLKKGGSANWIAGAIKHPGALHKSLGVPEGKKIPEKKLAKAEHSKNPKTAKRARLAETLKGLHKAKGGSVGHEADPAAHEKGGAYYGGTRPEGGRKPRKSGGRAKGKTNINIVIAQPKSDNAMPPAMQGPVRPPVVMPPPQMPPPAAGGPMAGGPPPMGSPPGGAPMMRKRGGRTYKDMSAGAESGMGRLEKSDIARNTYHRA